MGNNLSENNFNVSFVHSSNSTRDLQNLIDDTESDGVLYLGNLTFRDIGTLNVSKNISIDGGIFISFGQWDPLFQLIGDDSNGYGSFDYFNLKNGVYLLNNADVLVSAYAYNGTGLYSILVPKINISGNEFLDYDDSVVTESTNILKLVSDRSSLAPNNPIIIENNSLLSGIKPFKFEFGKNMKSNIERALVLIFILFLVVNSVNAMTNYEFSQRSYDIQDMSDFLMDYDPAYQSKDIITLNNYFRYFELDLDKQIDFINDWESDNITTYNATYIILNDTISDPNYNSVHQVGIFTLYEHV